MQPITLGKNKVREINMAYQSGSILSVVDKRMSSVPTECIEKFATLGLRCCGEETDARPSMAEVVRELEIIWQLMPESQVAKTSDISETMTHPSSLSQVVIGMDVAASEFYSTDKTYDLNFKKELRNCRTTMVLIRFLLSRTCTNNLLQSTQLYPLKTI